jgi:RNA polymerase sigma-70 factor (ECF subfamily)
MTLELIYIEFQKSLKDYIFSKVKNIHLTEDILQDVFLKINDKIDTLKDSDKLKSWIFTIARNSIIDHFRTNKYHLDIDEIEIPEESPENKSECYHKCLTPFINNLDDKYKDALLSTELGTLSQKDYAEQLGISYSGAKSRVQRAKLQIKDAFISCCMIKKDASGNTFIDDSEECTC